MATSLEKQLLNNLTLKITSLIIGYTIWYLLSQSNPISIDLKVPLCFYNVPTHFSINNPEHINVRLHGYRRDLYSIDTRTIAVHIDGTTLRTGANPITINAAHLFLPASIKLVHYAPTPTIITVQENQGTVQS